MSDSAGDIYNTSTARQCLVSCYMNRQGEVKSILLSQEFHFILGAEQTPDFLPCPRVTQSDAVPLILKKSHTSWHCHSMEQSPMAPTLELTHGQGVQIRAAKGLFLRHTGAG